MMDRRVREIIRLRRLHGIGKKRMAEAAGIHESHWGNVESGRRGAGVGLLDEAAGVFGYSVELVADHHRPFLELDPGEAYALMVLAMDYRDRVKNPPEVIGTLGRKLEKWTRGRLYARGRPRKVPA